MKIGRNAPCPCGSGLKYKNCCLNKETGTSLGQKLLLAAVLMVLAGGAIAIVTSIGNVNPGSVPQRVWSEEHQHYHTVP